MPALTQIASNPYIKALNLGDSGAGKTGALMALANAGWKVRILDFDSGIDVLSEGIKSGRLTKEGAERIWVENCTDKVKAIQSGNTQLVVPDGSPTAIARAFKLLTNWKTEVDDFGPPSGWGWDTVLVIDTLTHAGKAAIRQVQAGNNTNGKQVTLPEYGTAGRMLEGMLQLLYAGSFQTNVIVNTHVKMIGGEGEDGKPDIPIMAVPNSIGSALPMVTGSYFNIIWNTKKTGTGAGTKRIISRVPDRLIPVKDPLQLANLPAELPLETGLADYFKAVYGKTPLDKQG